MRQPLDDDVKFLVLVEYGYTDLHSWLEVKDDKIVGIVSATKYDEIGRIVSHNVEPTGLVTKSTMW